MGTDSKDAKAWDAFELSDLVAKRKQSNRSYLEFLKVPSLRMGLYVLAVNEVDHQEPHTEDEVYYIVSGRAVMRMGREDREVKPDSVVFVKAGVEHRFHSIKEELTVLVFFSALRSPDGPGTK